MVARLKQLADLFIEFANDGDVSRGNAAYGALREEFVALASADFAPQVRAEFLWYRKVVPAPGGVWNDAVVRFREAVGRMLTFLDYYGPTAGRPLREFPWLNDPELRVIVTRDYQELAGVLLPCSAWKIRSSWRGASPRPFFTT